MKKLIFLMIIVLFSAAAAFADELDLPEILIEGSEIENTDISDTPSSEIEVLIPDEEKDKASFDSSLKDPEAKEKFRDKYRYGMRLGTEFLAELSTSADLVKKTWGISASFVYFHLNPYEQTDYFEKWQLGTEFSSSFKNVLNFAVQTDFKGDILQLVKDSITSSKYYSAGFLLGSDLGTMGRWKSSTRVKYLLMDSFINKFEGQNLLQSAEMELFLSSSISFRTELGILAAKGLKPGYYLSMLAKFRGGDSLFSGGVASRQYNGKSIEPLYLFRHYLGKGLYLEISNKIGFEERFIPEDLIPIFAYFQDMHDQFVKHNVFISYSKRELSATGGWYLHDRSFPGTLSFNSDGYILGSSSKARESSALFVNVRIDGLSLEGGYELTEEKGLVPAGWLNFKCEKTINGLTFAALLSYSDMVKGTSGIGDAGVIPGGITYDLNVHYTFDNALIIGLGAAKFYRDSSTYDSPVVFYFSLKGEL